MLNFTQKNSLFLLLAIICGQQSIIISASENSPKNQIPHSAATKSGQSLKPTTAKVKAFLSKNWGKVALTGVAGVAILAAIIWAFRKKNQNDTPRTPQTPNIEPRTPTPEPKPTSSSSPRTTASFEDYIAKIKLDLPEINTPVDLYKVQPQLGNSQMYNGVYELYRKNASDDLDPKLVALLRDHDFFYGRAKPWKLLEKLFTTQADNQEHKIALMNGLISATVKDKERIAESYFFVEKTPFSAEQKAQIKAMRLAMIKHLQKEKQELSFDFSEEDDAKKAAKHVLKTIFAEALSKIKTKTLIDDTKMQRIIKVLATIKADEIALSTEIDEGTALDLGSEKCIKSGFPDKDFITFLEMLDYKTLTKQQLKELLTEQSQLTKLAKTLPRKMQQSLETALKDGGQLKQSIQKVIDEKDDELEPITIYPSDEELNAEKAKEMITKIDALCTKKTETAKAYGAVKSKNMQDVAAAATATGSCWDLSRIGSKADSAEGKKDIAVDAAMLLSLGNAQNCLNRFYKKNQERPTASAEDFTALAELVEQVKKIDDLINPYNHKAHLENQKLLLQAYAKNPTTVHELKLDAGHGNPYSWLSDYDIAELKAIIAGQALTPDDSDTESVTVEEF